MKTAPDSSLRRQYTVNSGPLLRRPGATPKLRVMNWLTLVALSAAGASGAVQTSDMKPSTPAAAIAPASTEAPAADEVVLDGVVMPRAAGGFLQLKMEGVNIFLRAYDAEKKPVAIDVDRASVRMQFASRSPEQFTLIRSADGMALTVGRPVRQPHVFRAYISLFKGESEEAVESYQVAYP